jgi:CRISPR-associated protein Cas2
VLWDEIRTYSGQGRAVLAHATDNEQGFSFRTRDHAWHPTDHEGLTLLHRPVPPTADGSATAGQPPRQGWSKAVKRRKFGG